MPFAHDVRHVHNRLADPGRCYTEEARAVLSLEGHRAARAEITSWPGYAPTPLVDLAGLAGELGLQAILYKDEGKRFHLKSFKALGGAYAVLRILQRELEQRHGLTGVSAADLLAGRHRDKVSGITVACATDGNHGRSVAWGAEMFGCQCRIYLHEHVSRSREREIARFGAMIERISGSYDDSVRRCAEDAEAHGWFLVADTNSGGGAAQPPRLVMQGYTVMVEECLERIGDEPLSHVFVQGGVGGLAAAVGGHLWERLGSDRPRIVVVEPVKADCIYRSIEAGRPTIAPGDLDTFMACLAAGEISPIAWPILKEVADDVIALPDEAARDAMRLLARGTSGDPAVVAGESGAAAAAGLIAAMRDRALAEALGLNENSRVLVIGSEGATDAETYESVVGSTAEEIERHAA